MRLHLVASTILVLVLAIPGAFAQRQAQGPGAQWRMVESKEVNLRLRLPAQWQTKAVTRDGRPCLEALSPRSTIYVDACSFRDGDLTLDDLLDRTLDDLGVDLDDDPSEEHLNGLDALVGEATTDFYGRQLGMFIVVASYGDIRYAIYVMTKADLFDANARTMNRIVDSLAPLATAGK